MDILSNDLKRAIKNGTIEENLINNCIAEMNGEIAINQIRCTISFEERYIELFSKCGDYISNRKYSEDLVKGDDNGYYNNSTGMVINLLEFLLVFLKTSNSDLIVVYFDYDNATDILKNFNNTTGNDAFKIISNLFKQIEDIDI